MKAIDVGHRVPWTDALYLHLVERKTWFLVCLAPFSDYEVGDCLGSSDDHSSLCNRLLLGRMKRHCGVVRFEALLEMHIQAAQLTRRRSDDDSLY